MVTVARRDSHGHLTALYAVGGALVYYAPVALLLLAWDIASRAGWLSAELLRSARITASQRNGSRELKGKGLNIKHTFQHNVTDSIYIEDPDGMLVELYCNRFENGLKAMQTMGPRTDDLDIDTRVATPRQLSR